MLNDNQAFEACPTCGKAIILDLCEPHPTRAGIELRNFRCENCGLVKTVIVSLRPRTSTPELAA